MAVCREKTGSRTTRRRGFPVERYERLNRERTDRQKKKRVAAYCRVSTDKDDQANSFESQQRYFRQYIERNPDWELYEIFADEGITGTNTKKRKEFNRMIACAKNGDFDLIITKEISRFARNTLDSIYYTRDLKKRGVGVLFLNDNINTLDGDAELRLAIMASIAQEESRRTSERVKWGQKRRMEQGVVFGRSMLGYDIRGGRMYLNEEGARVVRRIFEKFTEEGKGTHVIARELTEEGLRPPGGREWQNTVILRILRNEKYCGDLVQKKTYTPDFLSHEKKCNRGQEEFIILKNHHEPIISRAVFEKANRLLDERGRSQEGKSKYSRRYPFSGKIKCGCCGAGYVARTKRRADGSVCRTWRCYEAVLHGALREDSGKRSGGCGGPTLREEELRVLLRLVRQSLRYDRKELETRLTGLIRTAVSADSVCLVGKKIRRDGAETERLKARMREIEKQRQSLMERYLAEEIDGEAFAAERKKCDTVFAGFQAMLDRAKEPGKRTKEQWKREAGIRKAIAAFFDGETGEEAFCRYLLERIVVKDREGVGVYLRDLAFEWRFEGLLFDKDSAMVE